MTKASDNLFPKVTFAEGSAPSTPASGRGFLYEKTDGKLYFKDDGGTEYDLTVQAGSGLAVAVSRQTAGADYTTTSGSYADIDGTNLSLSLTTGAHRVKVTLAGHWMHSSTSFAGLIDVLIDGTGYGGNGVWQYRPIRNSEYWANTYVHVTAALSAASHTIKLQWKTTGGTFTMNRATFPGGLIFMVEELPI